MKTVKETNRFSKDFAKVIRRGKNPQKVFDIIELLAHDLDLPSRCRPHKLSGNWANFWECHIEPDWLLIYEIDETTINLYRTGSHSDLFR